MQDRMRSQPQTTLSGWVQRLGPVATAVGSALLVILGILVMAYPELLGWLVGIVLVLSGVALLASLVLSVSRNS